MWKSRHKLLICFYEIFYRNFFIVKCFKQSLLFRIYRQELLVEATLPATTRKSHLHQKMSAKSVGNVKPSASLFLNGGTRVMFSPTTTKEQTKSVGICGNDPFEFEDETPEGDDAEESSKSMPFVPITKDI